MLFRCVWLLYWLVLSCLGFHLPVREFDLRAPETCKTDRPQNVLINLNEHVGPHAEAKCLSINPVRPELLAVGANDPYVRLYDRRMLHCRGITFPADAPARLVASGFAKAYDTSKRFLSKATFERKFRM